MSTQLVNKNGTRAKRTIGDRRNIEETKEKDRGKSRKTLTHRGNPE